MSAAPIVVRLEAPVRVKGEGTLDTAYFSYPVTMTLPGVGTDLRFSRRYADFDSLRSQLCATYWYCIVPPLPEKETVQERVSRLNPTSTAAEVSDGERDLLEYRRTALRRFLLRVAYHPILGKAQLLGQFVKDAEWHQCVRDPVKLPGFLSTSLADQMLPVKWPIGATGVDGSSAGAVYSATVAGDGAATARVDARTWGATTAYVSQLESSLRTLRDRFQALVLRRRETAVALAEFAAAFGLVGEGEEDAVLRQSIGAVKEHSCTVARCHTAQAEDEASKVVSTLGYYVGMCAAAAQALQYMQTALGQVDKLGSRAQAVQESLPRAAAQSREQVQSTLHVLNEQRQRLDAQLADAEKIFRGEFCRFHKDKQFDMRELLKVFGELELKHAGTMKTQWDELRPVIERLGS